LPEEEKKREDLQYLLGRAEMKAGEKDKGGPVLLALMQTTEDAGLMNDSAYELAEAGIHLPEAEAAARKALDKLDAESQGWTLDEDPEMLRAKTALIANTWDTMGWILFREGKTEEAHSFVQAAWRNAQTGEIGGHLGDIEAAMGHKDAAVRAYELALGAFPVSDLMGVRKAPGKRQLELEERVKELKKAGAKSSVKDAHGDMHGDVHEALIKTRTIALGPATGVNGAAEYRLLLSGAGLIRIEAAGDKEVTGGAEKAKAGSYAELFPEGSKARLARRGVVNCHAAVCELVLEP
jgi:tetratricopeptide (TPR) repeat protein